MENGAEIQSSEDDLGDSPDDIDSEEDNDPNNDPTTNDEIDNGNGDEDDDDIEPVDVEIFDLASNINKRMLYYPQWLEHDLLPILCQ